eukprot:Hpha_TRINITY_DN15870_c3_g3::TRINITY_DN15870_c3_g3_i1::g.187400::m.187400
MALLAMLSVPALAQCPAPGALATVAYSEGAIPLSSSTSGSFPWLAAQGTELFPPGGSDTWLKCAQWWSLGPDRQVNAGESVGVQCDTEVCDVYAFLYHEPPRSSGTNGDLPAILPPAGWTPGSCAPTFTDPSSGIHCKMTAFRKQLLDAETTTIDIAAGQPAMYLVVVVAPGVKCDSTLLNSLGDCEAPEPFLAKSCAWEGGSCVDKWCKKTPPVDGDNGTAHSRRGTTAALQRGDGAQAVSPPQCGAPLDAAVVVYSTGVHNSGPESKPDTHWEVKKDNGAWVQPLYAPVRCHTTKLYCVNPMVIVGSEGPVPPSQPLSHPEHWWLNENISNTLFSWRQTFNVPASAVGSYALYYRVGWDDASLGQNSSTCDHTVWVNGAPQVKPPVTVAGVSSSWPGDMQTACKGTISGSWVVGPNAIEFRISSLGSNYGFRFIVMPPPPPRAAMIGVSK